MSIERPTLGGDRERVLRVDAHLHLWQLAAGRYSWLTPGHGELYADFLPELASDQLVSAGYDAAILVQAEDSPADTKAMLGIARDHSWVAGVVGWIPLDDFEAAARALDEMSDQSALVGIRHLVHEDPRDDFLELQQVKRSLGEVARRGLAFDVPDAWPRHLDAAGRLAASLPELTVVIDHLAKPPAHDPDAMRRWESALSAVAELPNTFVKVSGLRLPGTAYSTELVKRLCDVALHWFGPDRMMVGSDWPISGPRAYRETMSVLEQSLASLSEDERAAVFGGVVSRVYRNGQS